MYRFIKNIIIFGIAFFIFEKGFYYFLEKSPELQADRRIEKVITGNVNKDILVFGSSRGARNIMASQIEDSLKMTCFNLSYPGSDITFHTFLLESVLKFNQKPQLVILNLDAPTQLIKEKSLTFLNGNLYPFVKYNYINNTLIKNKESNFLSKILVLSRLKRENLDLSKRNFNLYDSVKSNGSMPLSFQNPRFQNNFGDKITYNKENDLQYKIDALKKFKTSCINNNIKLLFVIAPNFRNHNPEFEDRMKELTKGAELYIYNKDDTTYKNRDYYYDTNHLKSNGAIYFTNELTNFIKKTDLIKPIIVSSQ